MKPVRGRTALIAGVLAVLVLGIVFQVVINSGSSLPRHSWWEAALLLVAGGALGSAGWRVRRYVETLSPRRGPAGEGEADAFPRAVRGKGTTELLSPENARRTLVFAQAAAVGGGVLAGWYAAQVVVNVARWNVASVRSAVVLLVVLLAEAVGLSVLGFRVQRWCTVPEDQR